MSNEKGKKKKYILKSSDNSVDRCCICELWRRRKDRQISFSRTTVEQNGLKLWGSGAFFLPPQGMYYPVSVSVFNYLNKLNNCKRINSDNCWWRRADRIPRDVILASFRNPLHSSHRRSLALKRGRKSAFSESGVEEDGIYSVVCWVRKNRFENTKQEVHIPLKA